MTASDVHMATGNMLRKCTIPYKAEDFSLERRKETETMMRL